MVSGVLILAQEYLLSLLGVFDDLDSYSPTAKEDAVLGKVSHKKGKKNEIEITIEAFKVKKSAGERNEL